MHLAKSEIYQGVFDVIVTSGYFLLSDGSTSSSKIITEPGFRPNPESLPGPLIHIFSRLSAEYIPAALKYNGLRSVLNAP